MRADGQDSISVPGLIYSKTALAQRHFALTRIKLTEKQYENSNPSWCNSVLLDSFTVDASARAYNNNYSEAQSFK